MSTRKADEKEIFNAARVIESAEDRQAYLQRVCGDDVALLDRAKALLRGFEQNSQFLESPANELQPTLASLTAVEAPDTQIGPYKLRERIGEGGMGFVYVAQQFEPVRRKVALKIIKPGMDSKEVIARFDAERQALAMMSHPNIATMFEGGITSSGRPYFVMELVRGVPITEFCDQQTLDIRGRLALFVTVCHAVQHAHQKGIIHRDLKPSNVLVELHDVAAVPKVIDFGIAKATNQELTQKTVYTKYSQLVGTPLYMSPEQAELSGLDVDTRSDVYSLGVMLYELLTGTTPFDDETFGRIGMDEIRRIIREDEPSRPSHKVSTLKNDLQSTISQRRKTLPHQLVLAMRRELDWVVMKALEKDRTRRYGSATALAADIQRYLSGDAVEACPPSAAYRLRKTARRHKVALITTGMVVAALLVGTALSLWQAREATVERREATAQKEKAAASFDRAFDAVELMLQRVAEEDLENTPAMMEVRHKLFDDAIRFYTDLAKERPHESRVQINLARTRIRAAELYRHRNQCIPGLDTVEPAIGILESLVEEHPNDRAFQAELGASHLVRADLYTQLSRWKEGISGSRLAVEIFSRISDRDGLAKALTLLGESYRRQNSSSAENLRESHRHLSGALPLSQAAYADDPGNWKLRCRNTWFLANTLSDLGEYQESLAYCRASLDVVDAVVAEGRDLSESLLYAGMIRDELAKTHELIGEVETSLQVHKRGLSDLRACFTLFPGLTHNIYHVAENAEAIARLSIQLGRTNEAQGIIANLDSNSAAELFARAAMRQQIGDADHARDDLEQLYSRVPNQYVGRKLGESYYGRGEYEKAIAPLKLAAQNGDVGMWKRIGHAQFQLRRFEDALESFDMSIRMESHSTSSLSWIPSQDLFNCKDEGFRAGYQQLADRFVQNNQDSSPAFAARAAIRFAFDQTEPAQADLRRCYELLDQADRNGQTRLSSARLGETADRLSDAAGTLATIGRPVDAAEVASHAIRVFKRRDNLEAAKLVSLCRLYYPAALLTLAAGDIGQYREHCRDLILAAGSLDGARARSHDGAIAQQFAAWTASLAPKALADYAPAIERATRAVEQSPTDQQFLLTLGAVQMRAGIYEEAIVGLTKASARTKNGRASNAYAMYFRAMTEWYLRQKDAHKTLGQANEWADRELNDPDNPPLWNRKLTLELLREEAENLILE